MINGYDLVLAQHAYSEFADEPMYSYNDLQNAYNEGYIDRMFSEYDEDERWYSDDDNALLGAGIGGLAGAGALIGGTYGLSKLKADAAGKAITAKDIEKFEKSQLLSRKGKNGNDVLTKLGKAEKEAALQARIDYLAKNGLGKNVKGQGANFNTRALSGLSAKDIIALENAEAGGKKLSAKQLALKKYLADNSVTSKELENITNISGTKDKINVALDKARDARKAERLNEWASGFNKGESTFGGRLGESARGAMKDKKKLAALGALGLAGGAGIGYLAGRD